jgi:hypothetical protein
MESVAGKAGVKRSGNQWKGKQAMGLLRAPDFSERADFDAPILKGCIRRRVRGSPSHEDERRGVANSPRSDILDQSGYRQIP